MLASTIAAATHIPAAASDWTSAAVLPTGSKFRAAGKFYAAGKICGLHFVRFANKKGLKRAELFRILVFRNNKARFSHPIDIFVYWHTFLTKFL
jgi:hypothetical protein